MFLILKMALLLLAAGALGFGLSVYRFKRLFVEVKDDELASARAEVAQVAAERDELRAQLDAESGRLRASVDKYSQQSGTLAAVEQKLNEQASAVSSVEARIDAALAALREENRTLSGALSQSVTEAKSLQSRLTGAELTIKRKTELLRLSGSDPTKAALRQSWRPSDSRPAPLGDELASAPSSVPPGLSSSVPPGLNSSAPAVPKSTVPKGSVPKGSVPPPPRPSVPPLSSAVRAATLSASTPPPASSVRPGHSASVPPPAGSLRPAASAPTPGGSVRPAAKLSTPAPAGSVRPPPLDPHRVELAKARAEASRHGAEPDAARASELPAAPGSSVRPASDQPLLAAAEADAKDVD